MFTVTKYGHSCVLVETSDRVALFDAGGWSSYDLDQIDRLDRIVYTHEHGDHFNADKLRALVAKFPGAEVVCNEAIAQIIAEESITVGIREETQCTVKFNAPHEELPVPGVQPPAQNGYHFKQVFSHAGDSYRFSAPMGVLAMGLVGPWGSLKDGIAAVLDLDVKPRYLLPIHDWHFSPEGREWNYNLTQNVLEKEGIVVLSGESGIRHEFDDDGTLIS